MIGMSWDRVRKLLPYTYNNLVTLNVLLSWYSGLRYNGTKQHASHWEVSAYKRKPWNKLEKHSQQRLVKDATRLIRTRSNRRRYYREGLYPSTRHSDVLVFGSHWRR